VVNGLAVYGPNLGTLLDIEVSAKQVGKGLGKVIITGVVEEEQIGSSQKTIKRKSMVLNSLENVLTVLNNITNINPYDYNIHVNFPGGTPIDGPSAGVTMATAIYSAIRQLPVNPKVAMTGELSIFGKVKPIGGVVAKIEAAKLAGVKMVIIPKENWQKIFEDVSGIEITKVESFKEVLEYAIITEDEKLYNPHTELYSASPATFN